MNNLDLWLKHGRHVFLVTEDMTTDPLELYRDIERGIRTLPDTRAMFKLSDVMTQHDLKSITQHTIGILSLLGAWRVPEAWRSNGRTHRYVNPSHADKHVYADGVTRCGCGAFVERVGWPTHDYSDDHADDCLYHQRLRSAADVWERRRHIIRETLLLGKPSTEAAVRLGVGDNRVTEIAQKASVDVKSLRETGKDLRAETMALLLERETPDFIGSMYGISGETVKREVRKRTDHSPLEAARERTGKRIEVPTA